MTQPLKWDLYGNDHMSATLDKLSRSLDQMGRRVDAVTKEMKEMGRSAAGAEQQADKLGGAVAAAGRHTEAAAAHFARAGERARNMAGRMQSAAGSVTSRIGGMLSSVASFAGTAVVAIGAASAALGAFALKTAADNETAQISFEVLLGSVTKAKRFLADLQVFAASTPFDMPTLRTAASRLLAVGVSTKEIIPLMTALGDATAGMGTGAFGIERAVYALQQMKQAGKVSLEDINQLTDAGIPALDALAARLGTTVAKLREDISAGKVRPDDLFAALEQRSGTAMQRLKGMMSRQSVTLSGLWSTFKDNASQALAKFAEPAIPGIKKVLDFSGQNLPKMLDAIRKGAQQIKDIFAGSDIPEKIKQSLRDVADKLLPALHKAWDKIVGKIKENKEGIEKWYRFVSIYIIPLMGKELVAAIDATATAFGIMIDIWGHSVDFAHAITTRVLAFFKAMLDGAVLAFGWVPGLGDKLKGAQRDFDKFCDEVERRFRELEGKTTTMYIKTKVSVIGEAATKAAQIATAGVSFGAAPKKRAAGGYTPAGEVIDVGEQGPERIILPRPGWTVSNSALMGGGGGVMEAVAPVVITMDGHAIWQGLLRFKGRTRKATLGLA